MVDIYIREMLDLARTIEPGKLRKTLRKREEILSVRYAALKVHSGEEEIHDLRVAVRRVRAARSLLRSVDPGLPTESDELRELFRHLGRIRDLQIKRALLDQTAISGPFMDQLRREWIELEKKEQRLLQEVANSHETLPVSRSTDSDDETGKRNYAGLKVRKALGRRIRKIHRLLESGFDGPELPEDPAQLHLLRIAVKKMRYLLELFREAGVLRVRMKKIRDWQDLLGEIHDLDLIMERLETYEIPEEAVAGKMQDWAKERLLLQSAFRKMRMERIDRFHLRELRQQLEKIQKKAKG